MKNNHVVLLSMGALMFHCCGTVAAWQPDDKALKARQQQIAVLKKADKSKDADACVRLAKLMLHGRNKEQQLTTQEQKDIKQLLLKAVRLGSSEAAWMIINIGLRTVSTEFDRDQQLELLCKKEFVAALLYASRLSYPLTEQQRQAYSQRVEELLIPKAENGDGEAALQLAKYYASLKETQAHLAINYFKLAAQAGNSEAFYRLGLAYVNGQGVEKNALLAEQYFKKALPYFSQLAADGNSQGLEVMGKCYRNGYGVKACKLTALDYFWHALATNGEHVQAAPILDHMGQDLKDAEVFRVFLQRCLKNVAFEDGSQVYKFIIDRIAGMNFNGDDRMGTLVERLHKNENKLDYLNLEFEKLYEPLLNYYAAQGNKPKVADIRGKMLKFYSRWVQWEVPEASIKCAEIYLKDLPGLPPDYRKAIECYRKAGTLETLQLIAPLYRDKLGDEAAARKALAEMFAKYPLETAQQFATLHQEYLKNKQLQDAMELHEAVLFPLLQSDSLQQSGYAETLHAMNICNILSCELERLYLQQNLHAKAAGLWQRLLDDLQDAKAAQKLSNYYGSGQWVKADSKLSQKYASIAEALSVEGRSAAECYLYGYGLPRDAQKAFKVLQREKALQPDSTRLEFLYLMMQVEPQPVEQTNKPEEWELNSSINSLLAKQQDVNVLAYFYNYYLSVNDWYQAKKILTDSAAAKLPQGKLLLAEHLLQPHMEYGNTQQGLELLREAAAAKYAPAMQRLALEYLRGELLTKDSDAGMSLLRNAYEQGDCLAGVALCEVYLKDASKAKDPQQTKQLMAKLLPQLQQLAAQWRAEAELKYQRRPVQAMLVLGRIYQQGMGVDADAKQARRWYLQAGDSGDAQAMLECCLYLQAGSAKDYPKAAALLRASAELKHLPALLLLAQQLEQGKYLKQDRKAAYQAYAAAMEMGHVPSYFKVADYCLKGEFVQLDKHRAAAAYYWLYNKCHNLEAGRLLAKCYLQGIGVGKDEKHGLVLLRELAQKGAAEDCYNLGSYLLEKQLQRDEALQWLQQAAKQQHAAAELLLQQNTAKGN